MITRKNYFDMVCKAFTILVLGKLILEKLLGHTDQNLVENVVFMFILCAVATLILSINRFFVNVPLLLMMIAQYILLLLFNILSIFIMSFFSPVSPGSYLQRFICISVPYIIFTAIYYVNYFCEVKNANADIHTIRSKEESKC